MKPYDSFSGLTGVRTGIRGYEYDENSITILFSTGAIYTYTVHSCGREHLENMKRLADSQSGLNTYLKKRNPPYASKSR